MIYINTLNAVEILMLLIPSALLSTKTFLESTCHKDFAEERVSHR